MTVLAERTRPHTMSLLRVRGTDIVNAAGEAVRLRGTNLGGWLMQEGWMSPAGEAPIGREAWSVSSFDNSPGEYAARVIDGDPTHSWISTVNAEPDQWFGIDLGAPTTFNQVTVTPADGDTEDCWYDVRGLSEDGHWWTVASGRGELTQETTFQTARYLSVVVTAAEGRRPWGLTDLQLYVSDEHHLRRTLERRFGSRLARDLIDSFQECWITEADIDHIADLGMNSVRVPFHWEVILRSDGTDRADDEAFGRLDWVIEACRRRGLYVVLDLHGLPGGAGPWHSHGRAGANHFWSDHRYQDWVERIWRRVSRRYRGDSTVAAYDLINEPLVTMGDVETPDQVEHKFAVYDRLYRGVREEDPEHIIMLAAFFGWEQALPPDRFGWTDVVYETHHYSFGDQHDAASMGRFVDSELARIAVQQHTWNVPVYVGEFWLGPFDDLYDRWLGGLNELGVSWASWTYKVRNGPASVGPDGILNGTHWSLFHDNPHPVPNLASGSAEEIRATWGKFTTAHFRADDRTHSIYRRNVRST